MDWRDVEFRLLNGSMAASMKRRRCLRLITADALDLISKMMCDKRRRITLDEVLCHPFFEADEQPFAMGYESLSDVSSRSVTAEHKDEHKDECKSKYVLSEEEANDEVIFCDDDETGYEA